MSAVPIDTDLKYVLMPGKIGKHIEAANKDLYESIYNFWTAVWSKEMAQVGGDPNYANANDFLRQDIISAIVQKDEIAAVLLHTLYRIDLKPVKQSKYFTLFPENATHKLLQKNVQMVATQEYLAVSEKFRKPTNGAHLGPVIVGLSINLAKSLNLDACIGIARTDIPVNKIVQRFGAIPISTAIKNNTPVELNAILTKNSKPYPDPKVDSLINFLWKKKTQWISFNNDITLAA